MLSFIQYINENQDHSDDVKNRKLFKMMEDLQETIESTIDPSIEVGVIEYYREHRMTPSSFISTDVDGYFFTLTLDLNDLEEPEEIEVVVSESATGQIKYTIDEYLNFSNVNNYTFQIEGDTGPFFAYSKTDVISIINEMLEYVGY